METIQNSWIAVSTALNNQMHGDDQLGFCVTNDVALLVTADGISGCKIGRLASSLLVYYLKSNFSPRIESISENEISKSIESLVKKSVEDLMIDIEELLADEKKYRKWCGLYRSMEKIISKMGQIDYVDKTGFFDRISRECGELKTNVKYTQKLREKLNRNGENIDDRLDSLINLNSHRVGNTKY